MMSMKELITFQQLVGNTLPSQPQGVQSKSTKKSLPHLIAHYSNASFSFFATILHHVELRTEIVILEKYRPHLLDLIFFKSLLFLSLPQTPSCYCNLALLASLLSQEILGAGTAGGGPETYNTK